jgi:hypothetical protein
MSALVFSDERLVATACHSASILSAMTVNLDGPRAKIQRAKEHRDALENDINAVLNGKRHQIQLRAKLDSDTGEHVFRVGVMPDDWRLRVAVVLGDIVHCLRSALDQLAWQLVVNHSGRPKTVKGKLDIEFPIKYRRKALSSQYTFGRVARSDRAILDVAQPYKGTGNPKLHGMALIHQLSNRDKHRVLSPILLSTMNFTLTGTELEGSGFNIFSVDFTGVGKNLKIGAEVCRLVLPQPAKDEVEVAGYSTPNVRLPQRSDLSLMDGIDTMLAEVDKVMLAATKKYGI